MGTAAILKRRLPAFEKGANVDIFGILPPSLKRRLHARRSLQNTIDLHQQNTIDLHQDAFTDPGSILSFHSLLPSGLAGSGANA